MEGYRILIYDNNSGLRDALEVGLTARRYNVKVVDSEDALKKAIPEFKPDAVFIDTELGPEKEFEEKLKQIRDGNYIQPALMGYHLAQALKAENQNLNVVGISGRDTYRETWNGMDFPFMFTADLFTSKGKEDLRSILHS